MLSTEEIREIIKKGETGRVEFKSEKEKNIDFAKEIAAFANGSGGYLLVGRVFQSLMPYYKEDGRDIIPGGVRGYKKRAGMSCSDYFRLPDRFIMRRRRL